MDAVKDTVLARSPRFALGHAVGLTAFVWGFPLVESVRTCRLQSWSQAGEKPAWHARIDSLQHVASVATDADRDVVTPANDLLYTTGWLNLANGPRLLHVPSSRRHGNRYFVLALYDAWTNNFDNPGLRTSPPEGEAVMLVGPRSSVPGDWAGKARIVHAPTDLVWVIARVVAGAGDDIAAARALQSEIVLECPVGTAAGLPPHAVVAWSGPASGDTIAALEVRPEAADEIADHYLTNLCRSFAEQGCPQTDTGLLAWLGSAGLKASSAFDPEELDPELRSGLRLGVREAAALLAAGSRSRRARPWAAHFGLGRYGTNYMVRALTAYKGLGALAPDEAVYAMGDFDAAGQPLDGRHRYTLRFAPGNLPPVGAFWSVTMYAQDRFLYGNRIGRHAIGDRTPGLQLDADGGLTLHIGHEPAAGESNWLPAPAGPFYVVLRLYAPRPEVRTWTIPALTPVTT